MTVINYKKDFFIEDIDLQLIKSTGEKIFPKIQEIIDAFYVQIRQMDGFSHYFRSESQIERIKGQQANHWTSFWAGVISEQYISDRKKVGQVHAHINLPLDMYYKSVVVFNKLFEQVLINLGLNNFQLLNAYFKLVNMDIAIVVETYNTIIQKTLQDQSRALMEMSTPITQLWDGILLLPLVGFIDSKRAQETMSAMLEMIGKTQAKVFILDISGVAVVDTAVANYFIKITKASKLMGCTSMISGISGSVAQTIVELGIQIEEVETTGNMKEALNRALGTTGAKVVYITETNF